MAEFSSEPKKHGNRHWTLLAVLFSALVIGIWQPISIAQLLEWGSLLASKPWALAVMVAVEALLYTFALPGTLVLWLIAPFHSIAASVAILLTGSVAGGLGAYCLAARVGDSRQMRDRPWFGWLREHFDFSTQLALHILPGCPHWVVNYSAGLLRFPLLPFLIAITIGHGIKWTLYCWLLHGATYAALSGETFGLAELWPLLVLATLILLGGMLRHKITKTEAQEGTDSNV